MDQQCAVEVAGNAVSQGVDKAAYGLLPGSCTEPAMLFRSAAKGAGTPEAGDGGGV